MTDSVSETASEQPGGPLVKQLRELATARDEGLLTDLEFQAAKAKLLGPAPADSTVSGFSQAPNEQRTPSSALADSPRNLQILGISFIVAAVALVVHYWDYFGSWGVFMIGPIICSLISLWAGVEILRTRNSTWISFAAFPILVAYFPDAIGSLRLLTTGDSDAGLGLFAGVLFGVASIAVVVLCTSQIAKWAWGEWSDDVTNISLGVAAAAFSMVFFFVDGWALEGFRTSFNVGERWFDETLWAIIASLVGLVGAVAVPMFAGFTSNRLLSFWLASGSALALLSIYFGEIWSGFDGTTSMNGTLAFLVFALGTSAALAVVQYQRLENSGISVIESSKGMV